MQRKAWPIYRAFSMTNIKAIETRYKGYRFRSRLEARWAVFFDACNYNWEYEPEGFDLGGGVYYLPDFKIHGKDENGDFNIFWIEVKPEGVILSETEAKKISAFENLVWDSSICRGYGDFIKLTGTPAYKLYDGTLQFRGNDAKEQWAMYPFYRGRPSFWEDCEHCQDTIDNLKRWGKEYPRAVNPVEAARSARFEHGETP